MPTLAQRAEFAIRSTGVHQDTAKKAVETTIRTIGEPDAEMIDAGVLELNTALGKPGKDDRAYRRQLAVTVYRSMLARARV